MLKKIAALWGCTFIGAIIPAIATPTDHNLIQSYSPEDIIYRDVAVIGGGSSGTYTALGLHDHNYSVVVVEPQDHLGGHAETYVAPDGYTINIGVIVFTASQIVKDYFARFDVPLVPFISHGNESHLVDFSTGQNVTDYVPAAPMDVAAAFQAYAEQLAKYPYLDSSFNLTYPVPADLLLPFGDFVEKYNLSSMMYTVFLTNQGYAPLLNISTLYMLKYLNADELAEFGSSETLTTEHHNMQELYQKVGGYLGAENVYLNSSVVCMDRSRDPVLIEIQTPQGCKLIVAKKVVIAAPPLLSNLRHFDLSQQEEALFGQFFANGYYTGILNNTGLPVNFYANALQPGQPLDLPLLPGPYVIGQNPTGLGPNPGLLQVYYGSPTVLSNEEVKADVVADVHKISRVNGYLELDPDWVVFKSHSPFNLMVSNEAIEDRFYEKLFGLQGQRNTFWNGAAWHTQASGPLWKFTDNYVLPMILRSL